MDILTTQRRRESTFDGEDVNNNATMRDFSDDDDDDDGLLVHSYDGSSDLKSEAICMQEVEMSLMAENVFCNGLSTLLANLILRIDPINKPTDQPWAVEYKIGSECRFEYVKLPMSLHNRKFGETALIMYDYGVVLIATKRLMEQKWRVITPDTVLKINTIGLIITFHSAAFLDVIMRHIASRGGSLFEDDDDDASNNSSRDVQSVEDEFNSDYAEVPHHIISGGILAGDPAMTYEWSADAMVMPFSPDMSTASVLDVSPDVPKSNMQESGQQSGDMPRAPSLAAEDSSPRGNAAQSSETRPGSAPPMTLQEARAKMEGDVVGRDVGDYMGRDENVPLPRSALAPFGRSDEMLPILCALEGDGKEDPGNPLKTLQTSDSERPTPRRKRNTHHGLEVCKCMRMRSGERRGCDGRVSDGGGIGRLANGGCWIVVRWLLQSRDFRRRVYRG